MIDLGTVRPGATIYVPFQTFDSNDPQASVTITGLATTDIEIYKDGSTTQRASDAGYALLDTDGIDFDTTTGIHGVSIDLADNTTAGFYAAGSQYWVVIASITVDAATINFIPVTFRIGYPDAIINTTIATLSTQTSFTLTSGPAEDDALNGMYCIIHDVASAVQLGYAVISDYTGSTKTVTLAAGTTFTAAATDNISIMGLAPLQPTTLGNTLDVTSTGAAGVDWGNVENASTSVDLSATSINLCDTITTYTGNTVQTGDSFARLGAPAGASVSADIATVDTVVDTINTNIGTPSDLGGGATLSANNSDVAGATFSTTTDSNEAIRNHIGDGTNLTEAGGTGDQFTAIPWNASWDAEVQSEADDALVAFFTSSAQLVDNIWDEVLSKAAHDVAQSAGKRLRQIDAAFEVHSGTAQSGTSTTITLDAGASSTDDIYNGDRVVIVAGTGAQEHNIIIDYNGTTKVATMAETWVVTPDNTSDFEIVPADVDVETWQHIAVSNGATSNLPAVDAQAISDSTTAADNLEASTLGIVSTAVNDVSASTTSFVTDLTEATDDHYNGRIIVFTSGNLAGQATDITDYTGSTKTVTVTALTEAPANNDTFVIV